MDNARDAPKDGAYEVPEQISLAKVIPRLLAIVDFFAYGEKSSHHKCDDEPNECNEHGRPVGYNRPGKEPRYKSEDEAHQ